jgi:hypothetical protein
LRVKSAEVRYSIERIFLPGTLPLNDFVSKKLLQAPGYFGRPFHVKRMTTSGTSPEGTLGKIFRQLAHGGRGDHKILFAAQKESGNIDLTNLFAQIELPASPGLGEKPRVFLPKLVLVLPEKGEALLHPLRRREEIFRKGTEKLLPQDKLWGASIPPEILPEGELLSPPPLQAGSRVDEHQFFYPPRKAPPHLQGYEPPHGNSHRRDPRNLKIIHQLHHRLRERGDRKLFRGIVAPSGSWKIQTDVSPGFRKSPQHSQPSQGRHAEASEKEKL